MLTKYPRAANTVDKSLLTTLYYCCMYHWNAAESHVGSPTGLRKAHNFTDRQILWTVLRGRARVNHWPLPAELDSWLGSKVRIVMRKMDCNIIHNGSLNEVMMYFSTRSSFT